MNKMKKIVLCALLLMNYLLPIAATEQAKEISYSILVNDHPITDEITDDSIDSSLTFRESDELVIKSDDKIQYIYLKYASVPTPYTMHVNGEIKEVAIHGFLHELITLDETSYEVVLNLSDVTISDIFVFGEGQLPPNIQNFSLPYEKCDLLVFPTHADDDTLYFGIPITIYADLGYRIQVAYLTNHNDTIDRPHELLDGLWEMGVTAYPIISEFSDIRAMSLESAFDVYDEYAVLGYEVENIRRFKPDVILGHDENGEYGHGVHMLNTYLLKQAIELTGDAAAFPESALQYGTWTPLKTYLHMYPMNTLYLDENTVLSDGRTSIVKAKDGYKKHLSQQQWVLDVIPSGEGDCRMFGLYQSQVGEDSTSDIFEHIEKVEIKQENKMMVKNFKINKEQLLQFLVKPYLGVLGIMVNLYLNQVK